MTSISILYDKSVDVKRVTATTGEADTETFGSHLVAVKCNIQPLDDSFSEGLAEGSYRKDFLMFCDTADIIEEDKIVDGSTEYIVVGVEKYSFESYSHMELRITLTK